MIGPLGSLFATFRRNIPLLFDEYKSSTTAWVTGTFSTIPWILFGVTGRHVFAIIALLVLLIPPIIYYNVYGPFGIEIDYTPTRRSENGRIPDKLSERKNEVLLTEGTGSIFAYVKISERLDNFGLQFYSTSDISVELIDVPHEEHTYDREDNILTGTDITQYKFSIGLIISVQNPVERRKDYTLQLREIPSKRTIEEITVVDT